MNITKLFRPLILKRFNIESTEQADIRSVQLGQLQWLLAKGAATRYGAAHGMSPSMTFDEFRLKVPLTTYADIRSDVESMIAGEPDILWPGVTHRFAQSSGTSDGKSKFIPITDDSLERCHYRGSGMSVAQYLRFNPSSRIFSGKSFILGGSFANTLGITGGKVKVGDLSATLIDRINPLANLRRVPDKATALMADWEAKLPRLVEAGMKADVTNIAGVPSWFLTVIKKILERSGAESIHDVWPNLEVFFHGGIAFGPYRDEYATITDPSRMHYLETYNASEGFFGVQAAPGEPPLLLLTECGVFYEFLPLGADPMATVAPWEVEEGKIYELVITSCNGLWRYRLGDTVKITGVEPLTFLIEGRTKAFINAFGEELMVHNADNALAKVCRETDSSTVDYTAAPVYAHGKNHGRHQWIIEFNKRPADMADFAAKLDSQLRRENSDYDAKRAKNIFLDPLEIVEARPGLFDHWLAATGKRGGQRKVPRLSNDRHIADQLLKLNNE